RRDRNDVIETKTDVRAGCLKHIGIAIPENGEFVSLRPKLCERRHHIGERLELLDLAHERAHLVRRVADAAAIHHVSDRALSDLPIGRMPAIAQRVDHRILEVRAAPPGDEAIRLAIPALALEKGGDRFGEPLLHVDDGAVLIERERLDVASEKFSRFHGVCLLPCRRSVSNGAHAILPARRTDQRAVPEPYSAATRAASATGSTLAAQYLNSGIFPNGSSAGLVRRFAAASTNANGMNTTPSGMASSCRAASSIVPRRVVTRTMSPGLMPGLGMVPRERLATAPGSSASSVEARRVMAPVCQCSSWRPVDSTNGNSASGRSSGGRIFAGTSLPRPSWVGKRSPNTTSCPG